MQNNVCLSKHMTKAWLNMGSPSCCAGKLVRVDLMIDPAKYRAVLEETQLSAAQDKSS